MNPSRYLMKNAETARKWRALMQRRREHLTELYRSGRYKKYFTEEKLLNQMREAAKAASEWDALLAAASGEIVEDNVVVRMDRGKAA